MLSNKTHTNYHTSNNLQLHTTKHHYYSVRKTDDEEQKIQDGSCIKRRNSSIEMNRQLRKMNFTVNT